jgi:hypothetical protein
MILKVKIHESNKAILSILLIRIRINITILITSQMTTIKLDKNPADNILNRRRIPPNISKIKE